MSQDSHTPQAQGVQGVCLGLAWACILGYRGRSLFLPSLCIRYFSCCYRYTPLLQVLPWLPRLPMLMTFVLPFPYPFRLNGGGLP